jgi:hypothetical protein
VAPNARLFHAQWVGRADGELRMRSGEDADMTGTSETLN